MSLRVACHLFGNYIDTVQPDAKFMKIGINLINEKIDCWFTDPQWNRNCITFEKKPDGCLIDYILRFQQSPIDFLLIYGRTSHDEYENDRMLTQFGKVVKTLAETRALKVGHVYIETVCEEQLLRILPYFDANHLKGLTIHDPHASKQVIPLQTLSNLNQWKNCKTISFELIFVEGSVQNFFHCVDVTVQFQSIRSSDLIQIKEHFFKTSTVKEFNIGYQKFEDEEQFLQSSEFRRSKREMAKKRWFFPIPNTNQVLRVLKTENAKTPVYEFERMKKEHVPRYAHIWNGSEEFLSL
uniref:FTH domain-containing protein n=1 Tax=Caenorhabditis tropicalis TaxID=1561998 RepID=A0A1I7TC06_9PELO